jgi:hypothetical protein
MRRLLKQRLVLSAVIVSADRKSLCENIRYMADTYLYIAGHLIAQCPENTNTTFPNTNKSKARCFNCQQVVSLSPSVKNARY